MSTVMEPKKFFSFLYDGESYPLFGSRPQSPAPSGRFSLRKGTSSSRSSSYSPSLLDTPATSCVTRATSRDDCATQRFIVWAAVRRNACSRMTEAERLECPLLRCTRRFQDHESMLRHLLTCDYLESCEYWCYEHMRIERFDDSRCKKCLGHPSKRRKMLSMAKSFFTSLGHNKGKAVDDGRNTSNGMELGYSPAQSFVSADVSSISRGSMSSGSEYLTRSGSNSSSSSGSSRYAISHRSNSSSQHNSYRWSPSGPDDSAQTSASATALSTKAPPRYEDISNLLRTHAELPSTEIAEIDSRELTEMPKQASMTMPAHSHPSAANTLAQSGRIHDMTLSTPEIPTIAPVHSPTSSSAYQTPPAFTQSVSPMPTHLSYDTAFFASELDSTAIGNTSLMDWNPAAPVDTTLSCTFGGADTNAAFFPSYMNLENHDSSLCTPLSDGHFVRTSSNPSAHQMHAFGQQGTQSQMKPMASRPQRPPTNSAPRSKNLSPSSSVRSTTSTASSTSMNSIMSDVSDISLMSNATSIVSGYADCSQGIQSWPAPALMSTGAQPTPISLTGGFTDFSDILNGNFSACSEPVSSDALMPDTCLMPGLSLDLTGALQNLPPEELLLDFAALDASYSLPQNQIPGNFAVNLASAAASTDVAVENSTTPGAHNEDDDTDPLFSDAQDIAASAQDLLLTHVMTSLAKLRDVDCSANTLALLFQAASPRLIMDTGIQSLESALATGSETMTPFDTLCFVHLIYAFSLVTYEDEAALRSSALFAQSLEYSRHFDSVDRANYLEIVSVIWQPGNMTTAELDECLHLCRNNSASNPMPLSSGDAVGDTARAFLDDLEMSAVLAPVSVPSEVVRTSSIYQRHYSLSNNNSLSSSLVFSAQAHNVLEALQRDFAAKAPGLKSCLSAIARQLNDSNSANKSKSVLDSVRWFEIKLLHAGKASLGSSVTYFDQFVPQTKLLCDPIYAAHEADAPPRPVYHEASISLLRRCFDISENIHLPQGMRVGSSVLDDSLLSDNLITTVVADAAVASIEAETDAALALGDGTPATGDATPEKTPDGTDGDDESSKKVEVEADDCCELCGYRPKGDPKWFRGSMAKHHLTKHSAEVIYKCPFPNCKSQYRNRPDNLRQHQLEKNHFVDADAAAVKVKKPRKHARQQPEAESANVNETAKRPAKKRKTAPSS
ncbi:hypothetical protein SEPCBS119000_002443 [Sporothrix epigloea]|uniref:C2H2-type domain-containing protein n=1 Tax=Sporothrix epigloea TaxID=1892477 RepID=A0ABP0DJF7_9PEZI